MERIITIDGKEVKFKSTGAFLLKYKAQFKRDALKDIFHLLQNINLDKLDNIKTNTDETQTHKIDADILSCLESLDLELFYNLIWVLAKTADPKISPPEEWLDGFSEFPLIDIIPQIIDMIFSCLGSTSISKKK